MQTPGTTTSLECTRALAHTLYRQCEKQLNAYKPISKSIRTLRNKLEEADELFDDATQRPEDIQVLQAVTASKDVLERLQLALQHHHNTTRKEDDPDESFLIEFLEHVDTVTQRLSNATAALEEQTGTLKLILDPSIRPRTLSPGIPSSVSSISREHWRSPSMASEAYSIHPDYVSASDKMSLRQEGTQSPDDIGRNSKRANGYETPPIPQSCPPTIPPFSPPTNTPSRPDSAPAPETWKTSFDFFDPLSMDIDQASHMILNNHDRSKRIDSGVIYDKLPFPSTIPATIGTETPPTVEPVGIHVASQYLSSKVEQENPPLPILVEAKGGDRAELEEERTIVSLARREANTRIASDEPCTTRLDMDRIDVMERDHTHAAEAREALPKLDTALPVRRPQRYLSARLNKLHRPSRPSESRYRVVNADSTNTPTEEVLVDGVASKHHGPHHPKSRLVTREFQVAAYSTTPKSGMMAREPQAGTESTKDIADFIRSSGPAQELPAQGNAASQETLQQVPWIHEVPATPQQGHFESWTAADSNRTTATSTPTTTARSSLQGLGIRGSFDNASVRSQPVKEQADAIIRSWNNHLWDEARKLIEDWHAQLSLVSDSEYQLVRRLRHLLGIIASLKGEWHRALAAFIAVLNSPITAASQLDAGDCAASYWAADIYAIQNRRAEALLAYSIAERGPLYQDRSRQRLHQCICAEQEACRSGVEMGAPKQHVAAADSILNLEIVTSGAASSFLSYVRWQPSAQDKPYVADPNDRRSVALWKLGLDSESESIKRLQIDGSAFDPSGPWPLAFDPMFAMANVAQGRFVRECNLQEIFTVNPGAKVAKGGLTKNGGFTYPDMIWLIMTIRKCLKWLTAEWTESTDPQRTWFAARCRATEDKITTINYFSITIFKLSFRSGYGVDICPGGCSSARIVRTDPHFDKGVHLQETKRIKSLIRDYLDAALKKQEFASMNTTLPVMGINGGLYTDTSRRRGAERYA